MVQKKEKAPFLRKKRCTSSNVTRGSRYEGPENNARSRVGSSVPSMRRLPTQLSALRRRPKLQRMRAVFWGLVAAPPGCFVSFFDPNRYTYWARQQHHARCFTPCPGGSIRFSVETVVDFCFLDRSMAWYGRSILYRRASESPQDSRESFDI